MRNSSIIATTTAGIVRGLTACALVAGLAVATVAPASATVFSGTFSMVDKTAPNALNFQSATTSFSWDLTLNQTQHIDPVALFTVNPAYTNAWWAANTFSDVFQATFKFTAPAANTTVVTGDIYEDVDVSFFGHVSSDGVLSWDQHTLNISFTTGDKLQIGLGDVYFGNNNGAANAQQVSLDAKQTAAAVPEPMSIALLGAGFVSLGAMRLRRKSNQAA